MGVLGPTRSGRKGLNLSPSTNRVSVQKDGKVGGPRGPCANKVSPRLSW